MENNIPKLTNRELYKWLGILGPEKILILHINDQIQLSKKQLEVYLGFGDFKVVNKMKRNRRS